MEENQSSNSNPSEQRAQEIFVQHRTRHFTGRGRALEKLAKFVDGGGGRYLMVTGAQGRGKSSLLCQFADRFAERFPSHHLIQYYTGASGGSTNVVRLLQHICRELERGGAQLDEPYGTDYQELRETWPRLVDSLVKDKKVVIVLDGLDELQNLYNARSLYWLPEKLPRGTKVIFSLGPGVQSKAIRYRLESQTYALPPFSPEEGDQFITGYLDEEEMPSEEERRALVEHQDGREPLYLQVALEEYRQRGRDKGDFLSNLPPTTRELLSRLFDTWEENHGADTTQFLLTSLAVSRDGMLPTELQIIAKPMSEKTLATEKWDEAYKDLAPYLLERPDETGETLLRFFHPHLVYEIRRRYFTEEKSVAEAHSRNAFSFKSRGYDYRRTLSELPYHLSYAARWEVLFYLLAKIDFIEAKTRAGMVDQLIEDYQRVLEDENARVPRSLQVDVYPDVVGSWKTLSLIERALQIDLEFLQKHPEQVFPLLWNRGYWHDCPDCDDHYVVMDGEVAPWQREGVKLFPLVEKWRRYKQEKDFHPWLQALRPFPQRLDGALVQTFLGHSWSVTDLAFHPDSTEVASVSWDQTLRVWDGPSGELKFSVEGHEKNVNNVAYTPNGENLITVGDDMKVKVWNREGDLVRTLEGHKDAVISLAVHPGGEMLATGSHDGKIFLWNIGQTSPIKSFSAHKGGILALAYRPDGEKLVSGSADHKIKVWGKLGEEIRVVGDHAGWVHDVAYSPDGRYLATGSEDCTLRVWDVDTGDCIHVLKEHTSDVTAVAFNLDGSRIVSGSVDCSLKVWKTEKGKCILTLPVHSGTVNQICYSPDGNYLATGSYDHTFRVWERESVTGSPLFKQHAGPVTAISVSRDYRLVATASEDHTVRLWDGRTGEGKYLLVGHQQPVTEVLFHPEGTEIITRAPGEGLRAWGTEKGKTREILKEDRPIADYARERWGEYEEEEEEVALRLEVGDDETALYLEDRLLAHFPVALVPHQTTIHGLTAGANDRGEVYLLKFKM